MKKIKLLMILLVAFGLTACGGGGHPLNGKTHHVGAVPAPHQYTMPQQETPQTLTSPSSSTQQVYALTEDKAIKDLSTNRMSKSRNKSARKDTVKVCIGRVEIDEHGPIDFTIDGFKTYIRTNYGDFSQSYGDCSEAPWYLPKGVIIKQVTVLGALGAGYPVDIFDVNIKIDRDWKSAIEFPTINTTEDVLALFENLQKPGALEQDRVRGYENVDGVQYHRIPFSRLGAQKLIKQ